jgi:hypothetical protein
VAPVERWAQDPTEPLVGVVWWDRGMFVLTPGVIRAWRDTVQALGRASVGAGRG